MPMVSVVVTACNCGEALAEALASVAAAADRLHVEAAGTAEVVVVDDGSTDGSADLAERFAAGRVGWRMLRRPVPTSPAAARNAGAEAAAAPLLCFLDGNDRWLPGHLLACCRALADPSIDFVKTGVLLADPVHPDWRPRIEHRLVINLAVRRAAHRAVGGFPDYHLVRRDGDALVHLRDVFFRVDDRFYNEALARCCRGVRLAEVTAESRRHPGNADDRQYGRFRRPPGSPDDPLAEERACRQALAIVGPRTGIAQVADALATTHRSTRTSPSSSNRGAGQPPVPHGPIRLPCDPAPSAEEALRWRPLTRRPCRS